MDENDKINQNNELPDIKEAIMKNSDEKETKDENSKIQNQPEINEENNNSYNEKEENVGSSDLNKESNENKEETQINEENKDFNNENLTQNPNENSQNKPENDPNFDKIDIAMSSNITPKVLSPKKKRAKSEMKKSWVYFDHDSPRCQEYVTDFVKNGVLPPLIERAQVAQYIKTKQIDSMIAGKYKDAEKYYNLSKKFTKTCKDSMKENMESAYLNKISIEMQDIDEQLDAINAEYDSKIEDIKQQRERHLTDIHMDHDRKVNDYVRKWEREDALLSFSKPSPTLALLREREKNMIISKNFAIAADLKKQADLLEKQETKNAQIAAQKQLQKERDEIEDEKDSQIQQLDNSISRQCERINRERQMKIQPLLTRIKKLNTDKGAKYFPEPKVDTSDAMTEAVRKPMALMTPDTRTKYMRFKQNAPLKKLPMKGIRSTFFAPDMPKSKTKIIIPKLAQSR